MKKKLGIISMLFGAVLILSALALIINNQAEEQQAADSADAVMSVVHGYVDDSTESNLISIPLSDLYNVTSEDDESEESTDSFVEDTVSSTGEISDSTNSSTNNGSTNSSTNNGSSSVYTAAVNGYSYLGYLTIPALNLKLPVMANWSYSRLKVAPCRYYGLHHTDDMVIAAHNYKRHFGNISSLHNGDAVIFTDMQGESILYYVQLVETLDPYDISGMIDTEWDLTLFTCTYGGANRITVRCERAE